eukprot:16131-Heterococcus_DN1.PRE.1
MAWFIVKTRAQRVRAAVRTACTLQLGPAALSKLAFSSWCSSSCCQAASKAGPSCTTLLLLLLLLLSGGGASTLSARSSSEEHSDSAKTRGSSSSGSMRMVSMTTPAGRPVPLMQARSIGCLLSRATTPACSAAGVTSPATTATHT